MKKGDYIQLAYDWADFEDLQELLPEGFELLEEESDYKTIVLLSGKIQYVCACLPQGRLRVDFIYPNK